jgi:hypothetical protein
MDSFLVMISEKLWGKLTNTQLDTALKMLHVRMLEKAPEPYVGDYGSVPSWDVEYDEHRMKGFLELDAGPRGEHIVTLFDEADEDLMATDPDSRLKGPGLRQIVFLRTVN